jgi:hypothetical protein
VEPVHLGQGDVSVLSAGTYHHGTVHAGASPSLFFYLDRQTDFRLEDGRGAVGCQWRDLGDQGGYSVGLSFECGLKGLTRGVARGWEVAKGRSKRGRSAVGRVVV